MPKLRNSNKGDSNAGFLDWEAGFLPLRYRTYFWTMSEMDIESQMEEKTISILEVPYLAEVPNIAFLQQNCQ